MEASETVKGGDDAFVYPNGDKYIGEMRNNKKHGYGELIRKDGSSLKGYFVDDQFFGENAEAISTEPGRSVTGTSATGTTVAVVEESRKSAKQAEPTIPFHKSSSTWSTDDRQELLPDT